MNKPHIPEVASYLAGIASIGVSMTLTDVGALVGIVIAVLSFCANTIFTYRRDRREQRESEAKLARLRKRS
jgi:protein-L-isoaspartate O-methyltransferase